MDTPINEETDMKNWIVYGTVTSTGEEDHMYVLAETKAEALACVENNFGSSFQADYIVAHSTDGRVPLDHLFEEYEVHLRDLI